LSYDQGTDSAIQVMPSCPRCRQSVDSQAITCPYCRTSLKAHGHPGIPLYRAEGAAYLCESCAYHLDDTCNYPQRPYAKECTLYQDINAVAVAPMRRPNRASWHGLRFKGNEGWWILAGLAAVSLLIAFSNR
jgi:Double zinc ribbon